MELLEVSRSTLDRWRKWKRLPFVKVGKEIFFHEEDLNLWLRQQTQCNESTSKSHSPVAPYSVTIGYQSRTAHMWSAILIKELGLLHEQLANASPSHTWTIKWHDASNGLELIEEMIAQNVHIASLGDYPITVCGELGHLLPNFNPVLLAFDGKTSNGRGISMVIPNGTKITDPMELSRATITTVVNSSAGHRLERFLENLGQGRAQVIHQEMNVTFTGIIDGTIQAAVMWEPYVSLIELQNRGRILFTNGLGEDYLTGVVADSKWIRSNENFVIAYLQAHLAAHELIRHNPSKAARIISHSTGISSAIVEQVLSRVRWDAAVYEKDLKTLQNLRVKTSSLETGNKSLAFIGDYLQHAAHLSNRFPYLRAALPGDWNVELLY